MVIINCPHCGKPIEDLTPEERERQEALLADAYRSAYRGMLRYAVQMGYAVDGTDIRYVPPAANVEQGPI